MRAFLIAIWSADDWICSANCQKPAEPALLRTKAAQEAERIALNLESPDGRAGKCRKVIEELRLKNGDTVADIGAGTGYFARRITAKIYRKGARLASM